MTEYRVQFTVEARAAYDGLLGERRAHLDRALRILARDPFRRTRPRSSARTNTCGRRTWPPA
jgi:hypothetical protein